MATTFCKILGGIMLLLGLIGFGAPDLAGFHLTPIHNVVHLLTAAVALYLAFKGPASAVRGFCLLFGAIYLLLAIIGFTAPHVIASIIGAGHMGTSAPDHIYHLVVGGASLVAGLMSTRR
ncbi:MAG: DUF4383 domain-containing protein [Acidobacteriota bacterium]|nr:DUF4383 domain-containing protein [Acidobacteriota bacterium]